MFDLWKAHPDTQSTAIKKNQKIINKGQLSQLNLKIPFALYGKLFKSHRLRCRLYFFEFSLIAVDCETNLLKHSQSKIGKK